MADKEIRNIHLNKPKDLRRMLSQMINMARKGEMEISDVSKFAYVANIMLKIMEIV